MNLKCWINDFFTYPLTHTLTIHVIIKHVYSEISLINFCDGNFSMLDMGEGDDAPLLLKEGNDEFKFYSSGHDLRRRDRPKENLKQRLEMTSKCLELFNLRYFRYLQCHYFNQLSFSLSDYCIR